MDVLGSYHVMKLLIDNESESDEIVIKDRNWWMDFDLDGEIGRAHVWTPVTL